MASSQQFPHELVQLQDGRQLSYARVGDPTGIPILFFAGTPGSRMEAFFGEDAAREHGFDVYALDRPGFGYSTPSPGRTLKDWVSDVIEFADALKLDSFGVIGLSGGGPYLHSLVRLEPKRILPHCVYDLAGVVSPSDSPDVLALMSRRHRWLMNAGRRGGPVLRAFFSLLGWVFKRIPERVFEWMLASSLDRQNKHTVRGMGRIMKKEYEESYRQGASGVVDDMRVIYSDPGFSLRLKDIQVAGLQFWHGSNDKNVPHAFSVYKTDQVKGSSLRTFEGKGHLFMVNAFQDVFAHMRSRLQEQEGT